MILDQWSGSHAHQLTSNGWSDKDEASMRLKSLLESPAGLELREGVYCKLSLYFCLHFYIDLVHSGMASPSRALP